MCVRGWFIAPVVRIVRRKYDGEKFAFTRPMKVPRVNESALPPRRSCECFRGVVWGLDEVTRTCVVVVDHAVEYSLEDGQFLGHFGLVTSTRDTFT